MFERVVKSMVSENWRFPGETTKLLLPFLNAACSKGSRFLKQQNIHSKCIFSLFSFKIHSQKS
jgi:hypothetical protein